MIIGLLGCLINNENMGCVALTFSLINMLEKIAKENRADYRYYIFEVEPDEIHRKRAIEILHLKENQIRCFDVTPLFRFRRFVHHLSVGVESLNAIKQCDYVIDLTAGDSFTDIYGQYIFDGETNVKLLVEKLGKKIILGPQTYGPFSTDKNIHKARKAIEGADLVISRDQKSADCIASFSDKKVYVTTDLAFTLPWDVEDNCPRDKIQIGINVSGLLLSDKTENTALLIDLKTNYDTYIRSVIDWLLTENQYNIYIIPHVGSDGTEYIKNIYGDQLSYCEAYFDPISAKNKISQMDIFVGARMHATVAAFSSGVATIPTAYSRKFAGLYSNLGYPYIIDFVENTTEENIERTIQYIREYRCLQRNVRNCKSKIEKLSSKTHELLLDTIK